jgi:hypothetical protein
MNINPYESPEGKNSDGGAPGLMERLLGWLFGPRPPKAWCSFCGKNYREAGPLVEGPNRVYICHPCGVICVKVIEAELKRREASEPKNQ